MSKPDFDALRQRIRAAAENTAAPGDADSHGLQAGLRAVAGDMAIQRAHMTHAGSGAIKCLCCQLPISDKMIGRAESRAVRSSKKPVFSFDSGPFKGEYLCKQCHFPAKLPVLLHATTQEAGLLRYRESVSATYTRTFLPSLDSKQQKNAIALLMSMYFGTWRDYSRAPDNAAHFWVWLAIQFSNNRERTNTNENQ